MMKVIDWKSFGELIKEKRAKKNLTQAELAKVVNLSQPAISFIERGSPVGISSDEKQELLPEVLGIASEEIP
ncbi:helix-turn-helix transcriptional regulator, partial [Rivihabitans pingtungensis]|uniref:helix-turn-helix transcriptional regulator n=1 Tax=Rivihabitans pingtungensis TaxID=1054498 RepID=UPI002FD96075